MPAPGADTAHKHRLLVVEDDPATLALLRRQLERAGYEVIAGSNGREAVTALNEIGADIVVADWDMPEMSGIELCRAVHELRDTQLLGLMYFIVLTAHTEKARVVEALEAGADDFVRKPYDLPELLARIRAGERILVLQEELRERQLELSKYTAQLAGLNRALERLANTDTLTGLPNRRHVLERFDEAWSLAERRDHRLGCIMFDVDHFKRVNDTYGHKAGDLVLQGIAKTVGDVVRRYDTCGRFGGEEFLVVCPEETVEGMCIVAERIRAAIADTPVFCDGTRIDVTVSLGTACRRDQHAAPEALIAEADALLYAAKDNGRNRVWFADDQGEHHQLTARPTVAADPDGTA